MRDRTAAILALALTLAACSGAETPTPDSAASPTSSVAETPATGQGITGTGQPGAKRKRTHPPHGG